MIHSQNDSMIFDVAQSTLELHSPALLGPEGYIPLKGEEEQPPELPFRSTWGVLSNFWIRWIQICSKSHKSFWGCSIFYKKYGVWMGVVPRSVSPVEMAMETERDGYSENGLRSHTHTTPKSPTTKQSGRPDFLREVFGKFPGWSSCAPRHRVFLLRKW